MAQYHPLGLNHHSSAPPSWVASPGSSLRPSKEHRGLLGGVGTMPNAKCPAQVSEWSWHCPRNGETRVKDKIPYVTKLTFLQGRV